MYLTARASPPRLLSLLFFQCYYIGGSEDSATSLLRSISQPLRSHMPSEKICERLKGMDAQICQVKYEKVSTTHTQAWCGTGMVPLDLCVFDSPVPVCYVMSPDCSPQPKEPVDWSKVDFEKMRVKELRQTLQQW